MNQAKPRIPKLIANIQSKDSVNIVFKHSDLSLKCIDNSAQNKGRLYILVATVTMEGYIDKNENYVAPVGYFNVGYFKQTQDPDSGILMGVNYAYGIWPLQEGFDWQKQHIAWDYELNGIKLLPFTEDVQYKFNEKMADIDFIWSKGKKPNTYTYQVYCVRKNSRGVEKPIYIGKYYQCEATRKETGVKFTSISSPGGTLISHDNEVRKRLQPMVDKEVTYTPSVKLSEVEVQPDQNQQADENMVYSENDQKLIHGEPKPEDFDSGEQSNGDDDILNKRKRNQDVEDQDIANLDKVTKVTRTGENKISRIPLSGSAQVFTHDVDSKNENGGIRNSTKSGTATPGLSSGKSSVQSKSGKTK